MSMGMITVDGSAGGNNVININETNVSASKVNILKNTTATTPQSIIQTFMASLDNSKLTNATDMLDEAIKACSPFNGITDAITHFMDDLTNYGNNFLKDCCGIILQNTDTGAITGADAGGDFVKTRSSIVPETVEIDTDFTDNSFTQSGLTVILGSTFSSLSDSQKIIWQGLHSWWISGALDLIAESYGSNYSFTKTSSATIKNITVKFYSKKDDTLASVGHSYNTATGNAGSLVLNINMNYYSSLTSDNINGNGDSSQTSAFLDRTLAHELTHAVMAANISWFDKLPLFIVEGMAELTHGIDDLRYSSISYLVEHPSALKKALAITTKYGTADYQYAAGYMFLRYLAQQGAYWDYSIVKGTGSKDNLINDEDNITIKAYAGNDVIENNGNNVTIVAGLGNDTMKGSGTSQIFEYANGDGKDIINNFSTSDIVHVTSGTISSSSLSKNNVVLTIGKGTITLKDTKGSFVNVLDSEGNMSRKIYGNGTVTVEGTAQNETITAWSKADSINAYKGNDTLIGGKGNDTLTGGDGCDVFFYNNGDGNDIITDFNEYDDIIKINTGSISKVATVKNTSDIIFTIGKGSIRLNDGAGKKIMIIDKDDNVTSRIYCIDSITVTDYDGATINTAIDSAVVTLDASARTTAVGLIGNAQSNYILSGNGDDTITSGNGKDTIEYLGGDDIITDYTVGQDAIKFNVDLLSAKFDGRDLIFTTENGTLNVMNVKTKKDVAQKVTVIDKYGVSSSQIYGTQKITIANGDGDTVDIWYNSDVTVIDATKRTKSVYLIGNANDNTIKGGSKADTLYGCVGSNVLTGGKGNDLFIFSGGNDTITDYSVAKGNMDSIQLIRLNYDNYYVDGKNVIMSFKDSTDTLTIVNGKDKSITVDGTARIYNDYYEKVFAKTDKSTVYNAAGDDDPLHTVKLIDASNKATAVYITGNYFNDITSTIKGSAKADTIEGASSSDILTGGKGNDLFIYAGGYDTITDYTAGQDIISFYDIVEPTAASYDGNNLIFTTDYGTLTVQNAIKKNVKQKITILDDDVKTSQIFDETTLSIANGDGGTIDVSKTYNSEIENINASKRSNKYPVYIKGNSKNNSITGGAGNDTIVAYSGNNTLVGGAGNDSLIGGSGSDVFDMGKGNDHVNITTGIATVIYTAGTDEVTGFKKTDTLTFANGITVGSATQNDDYSYTLNMINNKKASVGKLTISGDYYETDTENFESTNTKTKVTTTMVNSYVMIGNQKVIYATRPANAYEERFDEELFVDEVSNNDVELILDDKISDNVISIEHTFDDKSLDNPISIEKFKLAKLYKKKS